MSLKSKDRSSERDGGDGASSKRRLFTDYVRRMARGETPTAELVDQVLAALAGVIAAEIRRRGLWDLSPGYLGVYGWSRWDEVGERKRRPLADLAADAFTHVFVTRLRSLEAQLLVKDNIDGIVLLAVRQFVHERQRDCDPLGTRAYEAVERAVGAAVAAGELAVASGDGKIRNETLLAWDLGVLAETASAAALAGAASRFVGRLLPDLITARGRAQDAVVERLRGFLPELWDEGIEVFRFGDLVDRVKIEVRGRWAALLASAEERLGVSTAPSSSSEDPVDGLDPIAAPHLEFEERDRFRALVACVLEALGRLPIDERSRGELLRLWEFLRVQAAEEARGGIEDAGRASRRQLAELLGIPRERVGDSLAAIGRLLAGCGSAPRGPAGGN